MFCLDFNGLAAVEFTIWVPKSSAKLKNATLLHYGHGLFASRQEGDAKFMHRMADESNVVMIASDWLGLASGDQQLVFEIVSGYFWPTKDKNRYAAPGIKFSIFDGF